MAELETGDRVALADLVSRYALYADQGKPSGLAWLFTADAVLVLPDPPKELGPVLTYTGRDEIAEAFHSLDDFTLTSHEIVGQVFDAGSDRRTATGRIACVAHHLSERESGEVTDLVWHLRYTDAYTLDRGLGGGLNRWRIARRSLQIRFIETRPVRRWHV